MSIFKLFPSDCITRYYIYLQKNISDVLSAKRPTRVVEIPSATYSVMQSDGSSFCEDVVLDTGSRDEDNILNQIYRSKFVRDFIMMILTFHYILWNAY